MHEVGLMEEALRSAVAAAGVHHLERLTFSIVPGGHVTPEVVEMLYDALSPGTCAAGAALTVEERAIRRYCWSCRRWFDGRPDCATCGAPGQPDPDVPDLVLTSIDVGD